MPGPYITQNITLSSNTTILSVAQGENKARQIRVTPRGPNGEIISIDKNDVLYCYFYVFRIGSTVQLVCSYTGTQIIIVPNASLTEVAGDFVCSIQLLCKDNVDLRFDGIMLHVELGDVDGAFEGSDDFPLLLELIERARSAAEWAENAAALAEAKAALAQAATDAANAATARAIAAAERAEPAADAANAAAARANTAADYANDQGDYANEQGGYAEELYNMLKDTDVGTLAGEIDELEEKKADKNSPNLTGVPTSPTPLRGTNTDQIATTAFVSSAMGAGSSVSHSAIAIKSKWVQGEIDLDGKYWYECKVQAPGLLTTDFVNLYPADRTADDFINTYLRRYLDTEPGFLKLYSKVIPSTDINFIYIITTQETEG